MQRLHAGWIAMMQWLLLYCQFTPTHAAIVLDARTAASVRTALLSTPSSDRQLITVTSESSDEPLQLPVELLPYVEEALSLYTQAGLWGPTLETHQRQAMTRRMEFLLQSHILVLPPVELSLGNGLQSLGNRSGAIYWFRHCAASSISVGHFVTAGIATMNIGLAESPSDPSGALELLVTATELLMRGAPARRSYWLGNTICERADILTRLGHHAAAISLLDAWLPEVASFSRAYLLRGNLAWYASRGDEATSYWLLGAREARSRGDSYWTDKLTLSAYAASAVAGFVRGGSTVDSTHIFGNASRSGGGGSTSSSSSGSSSSAQLKDTSLEAATAQGEGADELDPVRIVRAGYDRAVSGVARLLRGCGGRIGVATLPYSSSPRSSSALLPLFDELALAIPWGVVAVSAAKRNVVWEHWLDVEDALTVAETVCAVGLLTHARRTAAAFSSFSRTAYQQDVCSEDIFVNGQCRYNSSSVGYGRSSGSVVGGLPPQLWLLSHLQLLLQSFVAPVPPPYLSFCTREEVVSFAAPYEHIGFGTGLAPFSSAMLAAGAGMFTRSLWPVAHTDVLQGVSERTRREGAWMMAAAAAAAAVTPAESSNAAPRRRLHRPPQPLHAALLSFDLRSHASAWLAEGYIRHFNATKVVLTAWNYGPADNGSVLMPYAHSSGGGSDGSSTDSSLLGSDSSQSPQQQQQQQQQQQLHVSQQETAPVWAPWARFSFSAAAAAQERRHSDDNDDVVNSAGIVGGGLAAASFPDTDNDDAAYLYLAQQQQQQQQVDGEGHVDVAADTLTESTAAVLAPSTDSHPHLSGDGWEFERKKCRCDACSPSSSSPSSSSAPAVTTICSVGHACFDDTARGGLLGHLQSAYSALTSLMNSALRRTTFSWYGPSAAVPAPSASSCIAPAAVASSSPTAHRLHHLPALDSVTTASLRRAAARLVSQRADVHSTMTERIVASAAAFFQGETTMRDVDLCRGLMHHGDNIDRGGRRLGGLLIDDDGADYDAGVASSDVQAVASAAGVEHDSDDAGSPHPHPRTATGYGSTSAPHPHIRRQRRLPRVHIIDEHMGHTFGARTGILGSGCSSTGSGVSGGGGGNRGTGAPPGDVTHTVAAAAAAAASSHAVSAPAPVVVSFMYPGPTALTHVDYIIADVVVAPVEDYAAPLAGSIPSIAAALLSLLDAAPAAAAAPLRTRVDDANTFQTLAPAATTRLMGQSNSERLLLMPHAYTAQYYTCAAPLLQSATQQPRVPAAAPRGSSSTRRNATTRATSAGSASPNWRPLLMGRQCALAARNREFCCSPRPADFPHASRHARACTSVVTLASLNSYAKLDPVMFSAWGNVLSRVPHARLLLLNSSSPSIWARLLAEAAARGIHPSRLAFAPSLPHDDHVARYASGVDLVLDPRSITGHTTTADALWSGVPTLTLEAGGSMLPGRVSSSFIQATAEGVAPALITHSLLAYERAAAALCARGVRRRDLIWALHRRLLAASLTSPMLHWPASVAALERAYHAVWEVRSLRSLGSTVGALGAIAADTTPVASSATDANDEGSTNASLSRSTGTPSHTLSLSEWFPLLPPAFVSRPGSGGDSMLSTSVPAWHHDGFHVVVDPDSRLLWRRHDRWESVLRLSHQDAANENDTATAGEGSGKRRLLDAAAAERYKRLTAQRIEYERASAALLQRATTAGVAAAQTCRERYAIAAATGRA